MSGRIEEIRVFDTNTLIHDIAGGKPILQPDNAFVSIITEMEVRAKPQLSAAEESKIERLLSAATIVPLDEQIKETAIRIRRFGKPRPKLPDAIVAATAVALDAPLVTQDERLLRLQYTGLRAEAPA